MQTILKPPFPWFGGKSRAASIVWAGLGDVKNYVEPFFGSGATLFGRPHAARIETVNDKDRFLANFWRAVQADPVAVAEAADSPVNEADLEARHYWLITEGRDRLAATLTRPDQYDAKIAGWWVWGICSWIGSGWCAGNGPWQATDAGWVSRTGGKGIGRKLPHMGAGRGINRTKEIAEYMQSLSTRLRYVRVCCGDWRRVLTPSVTYKHGPTAILLDPPYSASCKRDMSIYGPNDSGDIAGEVREWAIANGGNPLLRIALCGYDDEHDMPADWSFQNWKAAGGYASTSAKATQGKINRGRERIWFTPACLTAS